MSPRSRHASGVGVGRVNAATWLVVTALAATTCTVRAEPGATPVMVSRLDLSGPFATRSAWRFTAVQDPPGDDPIGAGEDSDLVPGRIRLCLDRGGTTPCDPQLQTTLSTDPDDALFSEPHFLKDARVTGRIGPGGRRFLLVRTGSLYSINGNEAVLTQLLAYQPGGDRFARVYAHLTGRNNNEEDRLVEAGRLAGALVSVEPTRDAPFGYWVTVSRPGRDGAFQAVLRFRSATHYGDGNALAVIDSEMPETQRRLGLWRPGQALPLPVTGPCPRPHLVRAALWCR